MKYKIDYYTRIIDRIMLDKFYESTPELADSALDKHLTPPSKGGCADCFHLQPCLTAARLALTVIGEGHGYDG